MKCALLLCHQDFLFHCFGGRFFKELYKRGGDSYSQKINTVKTSQKKKVGR